MRTAVPGLCGTVIVRRAFIANVRSFAGFSAVLLAMLMRTVGTSTVIADVGNRPGAHDHENIPEDNSRNGVTIAVKTGDNAGEGAAMTADLVRFLPGSGGRPAGDWPFGGSISTTAAGRYRWHA